MKPEGTEICGSNSGDWMGTRRYREAQNGNPGCSALSASTQTNERRNEMAISADNTWAVPMGIGAITGLSATTWINLASVGGGGCIIIGARCQSSKNIKNMLIVHLQVMNPNPEQVW